MLKRFGLAVMALALVAALAGGAAAQQSLTWTAGAVGGGWYTISGGMAELLREKAGLNIKVIPGGGTQNPLLVQKGDADLGMGLPPLLGAAVRGEDPYPDQKMDKLRAVAGNMSLNTFHFYVAADSPFAKMTMEEIFKTKKPIRLAISKPGSSDVWVFEKVMEFYGYCQAGKTADCYKTWEAAGTKFFRGSYSEQAGAFKDRNVDGTFTFLALPGASITEASVGRDLKILAFPKPLLEYLGKFGHGRGRHPGRHVSQGRQRQRAGGVGHHGHHHHGVDRHVERDGVQHHEGAERQRGPRPQDPREPGRLRALQGASLPGRRAPSGRRALLQREGLAQVVRTVGPEGQRIRKLEGWVYWAAGAYAAAAALFHLYTAGYGTLEPRLQRSVHLLFLIPLVFVAFPFNARSPRTRPSAFDWLWAALTAVGSLYLIWDADRLNHRWEGASPVLPVEVVIGSFMAVLVIEACRRSLSPWMAVTICVSLVYLGTSQWIPGPLQLQGLHRSRGWSSSSTWRATRACTASSPASRRTSSSSTSCSPRS